MVLTENFRGGGLAVAPENTTMRQLQDNLHCGTCVGGKTGSCEKTGGAPPPLSLEPHLVKCSKIGIRITPTHIVLRTVCAGQPIIPGLAEPVNCLPFDFLNEGFWCEENVEIRSSLFCICGLTLVSTDYQL